MNPIFGARARRQQVQEKRWKAILKTASSDSRVQRMCAETAMAWTACKNINIFTQRGQDELREKQGNADTAASQNKFQSTGF
jgi:hypothetical protein